MPVASRYVTVKGKPQVEGISTYRTNKGLISRLYKQFLHINKIGHRPEQRLH